VCRFFGSARVQPDDPIYKKAETLAALFVKNNFSVITGGGRRSDGSGKQRRGRGGGNFHRPEYLSCRSSRNPILFANVKIDFKYFLPRFGMFFVHSLFTCFAFRVKIF